MRITKEQFNEAIEQEKAAKLVINDYCKQKTEDFDERLASGRPFTDDELVYAAYLLCPCGHGMAYPKDCGMLHYWDCSAILKGISDHTIKHEAQLPFTFYSIKSEGQPSSAGATTRGAFRPKPIPK